MIELCTPRGLPVAVPEFDSEDPSPKFNPIDTLAIRKYYESYGYVIVRGLFDKETCDEVRALWDTEIKPYCGYIYRQATARAEKHIFNTKHWVMNPILNLQSVDPRRFRGFREFATTRILTSESLANVFRALIDDEPKIVQSMYFEGNSATWEHQDTYYLDSVKQGAMSAAWIAVESISATAGRFFVCPGSHLIRLDEHGLANSIADRHEAYITSVVDKIRQLGLGIRAPNLCKGDVLFWNSRTIHGSLNTQSDVSARSSITCHAIPASEDFLQLQMRRLQLKTKVVNGIEVFCPKDQAIFRNRVVLKIESSFPKPFYYIKRSAIKFRLRQKSGA